MGRAWSYFLCFRPVIEGHTPSSWHVCKCWMSREFWSILKLRIGCCTRLDVSAPLVYVERLVEWALNTFPGRHCKRLKNLEGIARWVFTYEKVVKRREKYLRTGTKRCGRKMKAVEEVGWLRMVRGKRKLKSASRLMVGIYGARSHQNTEDTSYCSGTFHWRRTRAKVELKWKVSGMSESINHSIELIHKTCCGVWILISSQAQIEHCQGRFQYDRSKVH